MRRAGRRLMWALLDSNQRPRDYESPALTAELKARLRSGSARSWRGFYDNPFPAKGKSGTDHRTQSCKADRYFRRSERTRFP